MKTAKNSTLKNVIKAAKKVTAPRKIILFGSAARSDEYNDLDFLIIVPEDVHRRRTAQKIYKELGLTDTAVDIIVATEKDVEKYHDSPALVISPAISEGEVIYEAA